MPFVHDLCSGMYGFGAVSPQRTLILAFARARQRPPDLKRAVIAVSTSPTLLLHTINYTAMAVANAELDSAFVV